MGEQTYAINMKEQRTFPSEMKPKSWKILNELTLRENLILWLLVPFTVLSSSSKVAVSSAER